MNCDPAGKQVYSPRLSATGTSGPLNLLILAGEKGTVQMGFTPRGRLIRELLRLLRALDSREPLTVKDLSKETGMALRQVYRWVKAFDEEKIIETFGNNPARHRLKPDGSRLRRKMRG